MLQNAPLKNHFGTFLLIFNLCLSIGLQAKPKAITEVKLLENSTIMSIEMSVFPESGSYVGSVRKCGNKLLSTDEWSETFFDIPKSLEPDFKAIFNNFAEFGHKVNPLNEDKLVTKNLHLEIEDENGDEVKPIDIHDPLVLVDGRKSFFFEETILLGKRAASVFCQ